MLCLPYEIRVPIVWYEWLYEVSNLWNVYSIERKRDTNVKKRWSNQYFNRELKTKGVKLKAVIAHWYYRVSLNKDGKAKHFVVHRIVACSFKWIWLDFKWRDHVVCHIDDNKLNNSVHNLYIWTQKQNLADAKRNWIKVWWSRSIAWIERRSKITMDKANEIRSKYTNNDNLIEVWKIYWVSKDTISKILRNKIWKV